MADYTFFYSLPERKKMEILIFLTPYLLAVISGILVARATDSYDLGLATIIGIEAIIMAIMAN